MNIPQIATAAAISLKKGWFVLGAADGVITTQQTRKGVNIPEPTKNFDGPVRAIAFSADGRQLAMGGDDGKSYCLSTNGEGQWTGRQYTGNKTPVTSIDVSDSGAVIVGHADHRVTLWKSVSGKMIADMRRNTTPVAVAIAPRGHIVAIGDDHGLDVRDATTGTETRYARFRVTAARFSPDGRMLVVANAENVIAVFDSSKALDVLALPIIGRISIVGPVCNVSITNDCRVGICRSDGVVHVWTPRENNAMVTPVLFCEPGKKIARVLAIDFEPDGMFVPIFSVT